MYLDRSVETLKGVGPLAVKRLARLKITTVGELLNHYPRRYDDFSNIIPIRSMRPGLVTFRAEVVAIANRRARSRRLSITEAILTDETGTVKVVWFNQPYLTRSFPPGKRVLVSGKLEFKNSDLALQSPAIEEDNGDPKHTARIVPIYPETEGLTSKQLRGFIMPLLHRARELPETLPAEILKAGKLAPFGEALTEIHAPSSRQKLEQARRRFAFEELFYVIAASLIIKSEIKTEQAPVIPLDADVAKKFTAAQDFDLTDAQRKAAWQILQDMSGERPMNRLLEGDVGSGKTAVAALAATMAMAGGLQAALMVPTEILAKQHFARLTPLLKRLGYQTVLLVGSQTAKAKQEANKQLASGTAHLTIGTHALLSEGVSFANLGLVIIDEQHRFGVSQRQTLKTKAGCLPHLLSMTATPIPRSLALTVYGDLDISVIDEMPPGRKSVATKLVEPDKRDSAYKFIDTQLARGRQMFVVCPLIEDSHVLEAKSVTAEAERLAKGPFKHRRIGVVHGRLKPAERDAVMGRFADGKLDILVATSVIEVGVDIPNASIMLVEGAERFGLAALHQLRGRIGRGTHSSYCLLFTGTEGGDAFRRLQALERTQDGFRLAQIDLELRGPGEIYGQKQHGILDLRLADLSDTKLVASVRNITADFVAEPQAMLQYPIVLERINRLKAMTSLD
ncbi:MAG TPA: ATP-dependent DNA helicase RecG [Candidatus Dormibacteraeota bacterium]|nr:ATP-dependent DNA helicase RecG [Candidatus Dormibacteraeota bacterium]